MQVRSLSVITAVIAAFVVGCGNGTDPTLPAISIAQESLRSPSTFQYISSDVLWTGRNKEKNPAYIVKVVYDAQNGFGATIRECSIVAYAQKSDGHAIWNRVFGVITGCEDTLTMAQDGGEQAYIEKIANLNDFTKEQPIEAQKSQ
jgi:hypothetical protein